MDRKYTISEMGKSCLDFPMTQFVFMRKKDWFIHPSMKKIIIGITL